MIRQLRWLFRKPSKKELLKIHAKEPSFLSEMPYHLLNELGVKDVHKDKIIFK